MIQFAEKAFQKLQTPVPVATRKRASRLFHGKLSSHSTPPSIRSLPSSQENKTTSKMVVKTKKVFLLSPNHSRVLVSVCVPVSSVGYIS